MTKAHTHDWFIFPDEVLAFARILVVTIDEWTTSDVLSYFEKPWKWTDEHERWCRGGRPEYVPDEEDLAGQSESADK